jgi:ribosome-associated toxin RatA of RatAB toxin-antitoxin module
MRPEVALLCLGLIYAAPSLAFEGLCSDSLAQINLSNDDRVISDYFDDYLISRHGGVYHIFSNKQVQLNFTKLVQVMEAPEHYPKFMPGYRGIKIVRTTEGELLTAISFRTEFTPFTSRFTTLVETTSSDREYQQCWRQLDENDPRVIEEFSMAPKTNQGFWQFRKMASGMIEMNYFSMIKPPVPIPAFLYKRIVESSFKDVFKHIIQRTRAKQ